MKADERREFQRLKLAKPILALMNDQSVLILDIGIAGSYVEHFGEADPGMPVTLTFRWKGTDITHECEVARTTIVRTPGGDGASKVSHTGLHFVTPIGDAQERLQDMMGTFVGRVLAAQKANASGIARGIDGEAMLAQLGEARRVRSRGYVAYRLKGNSWWKIPTDKAVQPEDGFTVAAYEDEDELEILCRAFEKADEEGRNLIRLVAELSASAMRKPR